MKKRVFRFSFSIFGRHDLARRVPNGNFRVIRVFRGCLLLQESRR
jgi:hypothetical protein